jgi:phenylalanyl-tRNA synthetase alpha subunit
MATERFKENFESLLKIFGDRNELMEFFIKKDAFNEEFMKMITESNLLNKYKGKEQQFFVDIEELKRELNNYKIDWNERKKKITVDITENDIFSYKDSEEELLNRMKQYLLNEEFEKAKILDEYLTRLGIKFK